jgi:hypothetical protein
MFLARPNHEAVPNGQGLHERADLACNANAWKTGVLNVEAKKEGLPKRYSLVLKLWGKAF